MSQIKAEISLRTNLKLIWAQILCYKNQGIHWYHCNPTFLWQINFRLVRRLISALIWDISGLWNRSDSRDFREKRIAISRFLALYLRVCGLLLTGMFVFRSRTTASTSTSATLRVNCGKSPSQTFTWQWEMEKRG